MPPEFRTPRFEDGRKSRPTVACFGTFGPADGPHRIDLPREISEIKAYDRARRGIAALFDMADQRVSLLIRFVRQNDGRLTKGQRQKEFAALRDDEVEALEQVIAEAYGAEGTEAEDERSVPLAALGMISIRRSRTSLRDGYPLRLE